jgi:hypothetical protein
MEDIKEIFQLADLLIDGHGSSVELEFRFKDMNEIRFERCMRYATDNYTILEKYKYVEERVRIQSKSDSIHRKIERTNGKKEITSKTRIKSSHLGSMWVSLHLSLEENIRNMRKSYTKSSEKIRTSFDICDGKARLDMTSSSEELYQMEIEVLDIALDPTDVIRHLSNVMLDTPIYMDRGIYSRMAEIASTKYHYNDKEYFCISNRRYQTPKTMMIDEYHTIYNGEYFMTPKLDGTRRFLILFDSQCYSVDSLGNIRRESFIVSYSYSSHCIIDCEYLDGRYNVIDLPVLKGKYVGNSDNPKSRVEILSNENCLSLKVYKKVDRNPYNRIAKWKEQYKADGAIVVDKTYMGKCMKIKFENTVDLYVDEGMNLLSSEGTIISQSTEALEAGKIYEFAASNLRVLRKRADKQFPNSSRVVNANMSEDVVTMDTLLGRGCIMMRKMHNAIKRGMYHIQGSILLDIGTGQGGDVSKWKQAKKVFAVEPKENEEFGRRVMKEDYHHVIPIKHRTSSYMEIMRSMRNDRADIISLFFCLNMFIKKDLEGLYHIVREKSARNCRIIGIYMEATSFESNECYKIEKRVDGKYLVRLEGTRIDQYENKFNFEAFEKRLKKMGFNLMHRSKADTKNSSLSYNEKVLTKMFWSFEFRRDF